MKNAEMQTGKNLRVTTWRHMDNVRAYTVLSQEAGLLICIRHTKLFCALLFHVCANVTRLITQRGGEEARLC